MPEVVVGTGVGTGEPGGERGAPMVDDVGVGSSAGGGRSGSWPRDSRRQRLRAVISCRSAMFSEREEPSSLRMASMRWSRSAISPSRVVMYSAES